MKNIIVNYELKWMFKDYEHIRITKCKKVFNIMTGRLKKLTVNGGYSKGYWVTSSKFICYDNLNDYIVKIPKYEYINNDFLTNL